MPLLLFLLLLQLFLMHLFLCISKFPLHLILEILILVLMILILIIFLFLMLSLLEAYVTTSPSFIFSVSVFNDDSVPVPAYFPTVVASITDSTVEPTYIYALYIFSTKIFFHFFLRCLWDKILFSGLWFLLSIFFVFSDAVMLFGDWLIKGSYVVVFYRVTDS